MPRAYPNWLMGLLCLPFVPPTWQPSICAFWWSWRESNPRPESFELSFPPISLPAHDHVLQLRVTNLPSLRIKCISNWGARSRTLQLGSCTFTVYTSFNGTVLPRRLWVVSCRKVTCPSLTIAWLSQLRSFRMDM